MSRYDMTDADKAWWQAEFRTALRPVMDELKAIRKLLEEKEKRSKTFAYAYANTGTDDDEEARRREAMELYDGAAVKKEEKDGSDEVVRSGETG